MKREKYIPIAIGTEDHSYQGLSAIVALEEVNNHDLIYAAGLIEKGASVKLYPDGTNVKGELRYGVKFGSLTLGYIVCTGIAGSIFENCVDIEAEVASVNHRRFLPPNEIDIRLRRSTLRKVS